MSKLTKGRSRKAISYNKLLIIGVALLALIVVFVINQSFYTTVQSYTTQKGAPEKPAKGVYNIVTGTVYSSTGEPIVRAKVETSQKTVRRYETTGQDGKYIIQFPYCVNCKSVITYSATGYQTKSIDTYQVSGGTLVQDVVLQKLSGPTGPSGPTGGTGSTGP